MKVILTLHLRKKKQFEEAAFVRAMDYALNENDLSQDEILSMIKQSKHEVDSEYKKEWGISNQTINKLNEPSTSTNAPGIAYISSSDSDDDFIDISEDSSDILLVNESNCLEGLNDLKSSNPRAAKMLASTNSGNQYRPLFYNTQILS